MKFKILIILALLSAPSFAYDKVGVVFGGLSYHAGDEIEEEGLTEFNANHEMLGVTYNGWFVAKMKNSFYKHSYVVAKEFMWNTYDNDLLVLNVGVVAGVVSGYNKEQSESFYIDKGLSYYIMPTASLRLKLTNDLNLHVDFGAVPYSGGAIFTNHLKLTYNF